MVALDNGINGGGVEFVVADPGVVAGIDVGVCVGVGVVTVVSGVSGVTAVLVLVSFWDGTGDFWFIILLLVVVALVAVCCELSTRIDKGWLLLCANVVLSRSLAIAAGIDDDLLLL